MTHSTLENGKKSSISENTPLLATAADEPIVPVNDGEIINHKNHDGARQHQHEKPLPKLQIFLLCYARMIEPIAFFGIFPFISKMIFETGNLEEADVGFYAGLIVRPLPTLFSSASLIWNVGINVLTNANAVDDSMGSCIGSHWAETGVGFLTRGRGDRDCYLWAQ
jgi:hypothetical protein